VNSNKQNGRKNGIPITTIQEVIDFLNSKTGKAFRAKHPNGKITASGDLVKALLKKGYEVQDIKTVTARMCREWSADECMKKHLTPSTLYRASNFEKYLGRCV
jgi:uncharacterized phage protein (TIGR02220 family)